MLDIDAPLSGILPELRHPAKKEITTLDVLTHRSGLLMPDLVANHSLWSSREAILAALAHNMPAFPRGTLAYPPHEYGWILNEIVLRVDGRTLPAFFEEEIAAPIQLPALRFGLAGRDLESLAYSYWLGSPKVIVGGHNVAADFEWMNSEEFFSANNPATSLVTDADSLAAFYGFLLTGGEAPGGRILVSEAILRRYTTRNVYAWDRSLRTPIAMGKGFVVGTTLPSTFGWWNTTKCFGHAGGFSSLAFADSGTGISVAILTNVNRSLSDFTKRFLPLAGGIRKACRYLSDAR